MGIVFTWEFHEHFRHHIGQLRSWGQLHYGALTILSLVMFRWNPSHPPTLFISPCPNLPSYFHFWLGRGSELSNLRRWFGLPPSPARSSLILMNICMSIAERFVHRRRLRVCTLLRVTYNFLGNQWISNRRALHLSPVCSTPISSQFGKSLPLHLQGPSG